jgi:hypothetical protein
MAAAPIESAAQAKPLFAEVVRWAARVGMRFHGMPLEVRLRRSAPNRPGHLGVTIHQRLWRGRKLVRNRIHAMEIVQGLAPLRFQGVVAHELGHVWLAVHRIWLPTAIEEGFCELLAWRFYGDLGTEEARLYAQEIEANSDPVYGGGFQYVRQVLPPSELERCLKERKVPLRLLYPRMAAVG